MDYPKDMAKQALQFYKATFDNGYSTMVMLQDQAEKIVRNLMDQAPWMNADARRILDQWIDTYKKGREEFKKAMDDGYAKVEEYFAKVGR
ncbi:MAG TPA: hypothetical protein PLS81_01085 [Deltaproteobacteria bacterium]|nr:hypothetical protein [Deltaproteobacteria bacterium]HOM28036.1 hypothetical protein [Deltaproteobacteria bacterium]HPP80124.1 hypothetical protein [Deltaproteobacteria bacterium]